MSQAFILILRGNQIQRVEYIRKIIDPKWGMKVKMLKILTPKGELVCRHGSIIRKIIRKAFLCNQIQANFNKWYSELIQKLHENPDEVNKMLTEMFQKCDFVLKVRRRDNALIIEDILERVTTLDEYFP